jgi:hypothetical protein
MGFAEEFKDLDPNRMERAFANVSERLIVISETGDELVEQIHDNFELIEQASPGFMVLIGRFEETIQMMDVSPEGSFGRSWFRMIQMNLGAVSVGLVLAEYARLETEES